jgi:hypothetical protein
MADEYDDDVQDEQPDNANIRQLREKAKRADELEAQLAAMQRNEAFRSAGLDPADKKASYFVKGYEGDLTPEAIRAAASEAGFIQAEQAQPPAQQSHVPDSMERLFAASAGSAAPPAMDWHDALAEADRIQDPQAREDAILGVVERYGGTTSRTAQ